jgi:large subunit ribosomal protein L13
LKTYVPKAGDLRREWWLVDADGLTLGRLSTVVAHRLVGKHKPVYTPFLDAGDHVVVVNAAKVKMTGAKLKDKFYRHHTGYPGGLKETTAGKLMQKQPERIIESAVKGMLPKSRLGRAMAKKLKVYAGPKHPHEAQKPQPLPVPGAARART